MSQDPREPLTTVAALRCGRCGGSFHEGDAFCPWCRAGIALEDRGRSHVCARCARRAPTSAAWCPGCGQRLGEQSVAPAAPGARCPACTAELRERSVGERRMTECSGCGGLWITAALLDELCGEAERAGIAHAAPALPPARVEPDPRYRPCPGCAALMLRRNFGGSSGIVIDVCREHGVWLDPQELEHVLAWARAGGLEAERRRRVERARRATAIEPQGRGPTPPLPDRVTGGGGLLEALSWLALRLG